MNGLVASLMAKARLILGRPRIAVESPQYGYADLRGGGSRIAIIPQLGGRITALEIGGREWLAPRSMSTPVPGLGDEEERGGFEEFFPTAVAATIPGWVQGFGGISLPDRGELRMQRPAFEVSTAGRPTATTTWIGELMPYELRRTIQVNADGSITFGYVATNKGKAPLPFVWSAQPVLRLTPKTRILLPEGILARVVAQEGIELGGGSREQRWPRFRLGDRLVDMSRPDSIGARYACKLFFDMPRDPVAIEEGDMRLEIVADARDVPHLGLWISRGRSAGRGSAERVLALQPSIGAPDSLADALGEWKSVQWLAPDSAREWQLTFRARPLTSETRAARETPAESRSQSR